MWRESEEEADVLACLYASRGTEPAELVGLSTTRVHEPAPMATLLAILALGAALDFGWKRVHAGRAWLGQIGRSASA